MKNSDHVDYIYIGNYEGCWSYLGMQEGKVRRQYFCNGTLFCIIYCQQQDLALDWTGCLSKATIQQELIHALGYTHMHNNIDRDRYVTVQWNNIETRHKHNFDKVQAWKYDNFGTPYDYCCTMHYSSKAFSANGRNTTVPKGNSKKTVIGNVSGLSLGDIQRLNKMYGCP